MIFVKNLTEFYQISLKNLPNLTHLSAQLMACMKFIHVILLQHPLLKLGHFLNPIIYEKESVISQNLVLKVIH